MNLAKSILLRGYPSFIHHGDWQAAPPGFLLLTRCVFRSSARRTIARFTSFIFGVSALPYFTESSAGAFRRRVTYRHTCSRPLAIYFNELKQYSCDVAVTLELFWR